MVMDGTQTYCVDHFIMCTNIQSLHCTPESNKYNITCQLFLNNKTFQIK